MTSDPPAPPHGSLDRRALGRLGGAIALLSLPAIVGHHAVARAAALWPLAESAHPYFVPAHAPLLYLVVPLVALGACVLFLAPGLFLALALGRGRDPAEWVLAGLALSLVVVSVVVGVAQAVTGVAPVGATFAWLVVGCALAAAALAAWRAAAHQALASPIAPRGARSTLIAMLVVPAVLAAVLAPKFLWESFNGDGAHAFESTRQLLVRPLPFWPADAGAISNFPGITSMLFTFPGSWFIRLFGANEGAARLSFLLYLQGLAAAVLALSRHARRGERGADREAAEPWLVWAALTVYAVTMAYSATYNPYMADIALPATQDTLLMVCFLGFILAFVRGELWWLTLFGVLTYVSLPSGIILMAFWLAATFLVVRPRPTRELTAAALLLAACVAWGALLPRLLAAAGLPRPGDEYGLVGLLRYFAFLQLTDAKRLLYVVVPAGILPALALLAWRRQDHTTRALTLVTVAYFLFFFVQAQISLHHFVPAMLLPLIVLWRTVPVEERSRRRAEWGVLAGAALALAMALPRSARPDVSGRRVGETLVSRIGDYERLDPAAYRHTGLLTTLFPLDWDPVVPGRYGGSPLVWNHYARRDRGAERSANYVLQPSDAPAPPGMRILDFEEGAALYVRSDSVWSVHRALRPPTPAGSLALRVPRGMLFRSVPLENGPRVIDVVALLEHMGLDTAPILARLGVHR